MTNGESCDLTQNIWNPFKINIYVIYVDPIHIKHMHADSETNCFCRRQQFTTKRICFDTGGRIYPLKNMKEDPH